MLFMAYIGEMAKKVVCVMKRLFSLSRERAHVVLIYTHIR